MVRDRVNTCLTPARASASQKVAFLIGDSHAASIKPSIERAVQGEMILSWVAVTGNTCGYIYSATSGVCLDVRNRMRQRLEANVLAGDVVFVSHVGYKYYDAQSQQLQRDLLQDLYMNVLRPRGAKLVIMGDPPRLPMHAVRCLYNPSNCYASTTNIDQNQQLASLATNQAGILYLEIHGLFCDSSNCYGQVPGTSTWAFFDNSHLTLAGGLYLWPYICSWLEQAGFM